jgi:hypothetical protein
MIDDAYIQALAEYFGITTDQVRAMGVSRIAAAAERNGALSQVMTTARRIRLIDQLEQEIKALNLQISMACQEPADDCECPGCLKADAFHGVER